MASLGHTRLDQPGLDVVPWRRLTWRRKARCHQRGGCNYRVARVLRFAGSDVRIAIAA